MTKNLNIKKSIMCMRIFVSFYVLGNTLKIER